jgi:hypothetical protein
MPENPSNHAARLTNGCTLGGAVRWGLGWVTSPAPLPTLPLEWLDL